jgi:hypothetical protein
MLTSGPQNQRTVQNGIGGHGIMPASGYYGPSWPSRSGTVIPQGVSTGGWVLDPTTTTTYDRGYVQQTFLGASIRNFSMNGGFGDSSSTLSVELVNDEFNNSDRTGQGAGDDVYHSGLGDRFVPPIAGSPVYFKFGQNLATVEEAYRKTFDDLYGYNTFTSFSTINLGGNSFDKDNFTSLSPNNFVNLETNQIVDFTSVTTGESRGSGHIVFGGILQSYIQNRGPGGNPLYSVQVTDPREILSNVIVILNNYAGTTFDTQNIFNVYGFLEHNMTEALSGNLQSHYGQYNMLTKSVDPNNGYISYVGSATSSRVVSPEVSGLLDCWYKEGGGWFGGRNEYFPLTGTGFSRRGTQGIPYYRVKQALGALMSIGYNLPQEYKNKGYGKKINFRGYNYVVDFSGLKDIPPMYFLDFDQINLLDLALEICDVTSRDLYVSLLPVIPHPACQVLLSNQTSNDLIAGIIRLDSIDRSHAPRYGAIKTYIDTLASRGILVENQDVGYELSNVTTDKFVVGAQEIDMYYFTSNFDRGMSNARTRTSDGTDWNQWLLEKQEEQQILPYYGLLGNNAVTIPKGWGSYQQILLDTTGLNANGVGAYYVTTEMELRCASVSYECWKNFLQQYNDVYMESMEEDDSYEGAAMNQSASFGGVANAPNISNNYAVSVPRSVFETCAITPFTNGYPTSPCNPPYGYPLYYKRMTKLGIPEGGLTKLQHRITTMITGAAAIRGADAENYQEIRNNQLEELEYIAEDYGSLSSNEKQYYDQIKASLQQTPPNIDLLNDVEESLHKISAVLPRLAKKGTQNALKVYEFLKKVADDNLGKKFLVKIPNKVNLHYQNSMTKSGQNVTAGPFGFKPRPTSSGIGDEFSPTFINQYRGEATLDMVYSYCQTGITPNQKKYNGALKGHFNPMTDKHEFNYSPVNIGGYFPFDLYTNTLPANIIDNLPDNVKPLGVVQMLVPQDLTNFLDENGRAYAYARFDHSQHLSFSSMNAEDFTQQLITSQGMVPDLCEFLENTGEDKWESFKDTDADKPDNDATKPKQCSFVKCAVDEKFYMPPKILPSSLTVYGAANSRTKVSRPRKIFIPCSGWTGGIKYQLPLIPGTGVYVDSFRYSELNYYPTTSSITSATRYVFDKKFESALNSMIIRTDFPDLDTSCVYALITLPNKIVPTKDARYRDSVNQRDNGYSIKHYLTMDVVKGLPEFNDPGYSSKSSTTNLLAGDTYCKHFPVEARSAAWLASKKAKSALQFGFPQQIQMTAPSPVYPDLVALPLMSNERCYGPWVSSQVDPQGSAYSNIGGRVEFIKDENLAPWNYAGYDLLNIAGVTQAQFANSLLLFSERGGFTYPGMPTASLCKTLLDGGPLVTNITVDVSDNGIKTTYKMDLYTASFGKLQKQKQDMISKISRERQKLRDERNALIRKGIGKGQTSVNIVGAINMFGNNGTIPSAPRQMNHIVASVAQYETQSYSPSLASIGGLFGDNAGSSAGNINQIDSVYSASLQSPEDIFDTFNTFDSVTQRQSAEYNAGAVRMDDMYIPYSKEPYHPNMPNMQHPDYRANNRLYESDEFKIDDETVTPPT